MALVVKDRVKETTATTGTGILTLAGAVTGFQSFSSALSDGDTTYYAIFESSTGEWEVGLGTFTASGTTLARTTVLASSNSGSAVNLTAGAADVFITQPATKAAYFDGSGDLVLNQDPTSNLQAATKQYVDTIAAAGLHYHDPVRVQTTGNLSATYNNGSSGVGATLTNSGTQAAISIDNVTLSSADRVLVSEQTNAAHNGVYTVTTVGSGSTNWVLTRATDADSYGPSDPDALGEGDAFFIKEGDTNAGHLDVMTTSGTITFGTTDIVFSEVAETTVYSAGNGLTLTGTTFAAGAGTGVTVNANDIAIGQDVGTTADVTFNSVTASLTGNVTGNVSGSSGSTTGNAATATKLATSRTISLTGDVTGSASFDGSANASIAATIGANSVALGTDTTGNYVASGAVSGNGLSGSASAEGAAFTVTSNATNANTASTIVFRDASGNFSAGTITADLNGNASTATSATNADTVDSLHASQFLRSDANDTATGELTFNAKLDIAGGTYLGWGGGTNRPSVTGDKSNNLLTFYTGGAERFHIDNDGVDVTGTLSTDDISIDSGNGLLGIEFTDNLYIGGNSSHAKIGFGNSVIYGSAGNGTNVSNTIDIGLTDNRFKDLYLAGNADVTGAITTSGQLTVDNDNGIKVISGTETANVYYTGYGIDSARSTTYIRPQADNAQTLYIGNFNDGLDWNSIQMKVGSNDNVSINGNTVFHQANLIESTTFSGTYPVLFGIDDTTGRIFENSNVTFDGTANNFDVNGNITATNMYVASALLHEGDTDTFLSFGTDAAYLSTGGTDRIIVNSSGVRLGDSGNGYFQPVSGNFGSIQIDGGAHGGYEGYSIGGRAVFMHDNSANMGLYDDVNNKWAVLHNMGGSTYIYDNGAVKINTTSTGVNVTGTAEVDTLTFSDGSSQTSAGASTGKAIAMAIVFG